MKAITEKQALQNAADFFGGVVIEHFENDKRKSQRYFVKIGDVCSPVLDYNRLTHFILGVIFSLKNAK